MTSNILELRENLDLHYPNSIYKIHTLSHNSNPPNPIPTLLQPFHIGTQIETYSRPWHQTKTSSLAASNLASQPPAPSQVARSIAPAKPSRTLVAGLETRSSLLISISNRLSSPPPMPTSSSPRTANPPRLRRVTNTTNGWGNGARDYGNGVKDATKASGTRSQTAQNPLGTGRNAVSGRQTVVGGGGKAGGKGSAGNPLGLGK